MPKLDNQERLIVRELIRDPRISDNQIAIRTNVPLKSVNRKRKILEEKNILNYYTYLDNTTTGTGTFTSRNMYIIVLKNGVTRKELTERLRHSQKEATFFTKHMFMTFIGDYCGRVALIALIESLKSEDIIEIYNAEIVKELESYFGPNCISETITIPIMANQRILRNYIPNKNIKDGKIAKEWPDSNIFIDD